MILCFEAILGLVINLLQNIDWPHYWIVKWDLYRMNYLAMWLGSSYKTTAVWNLVVERTEKGLVQCKNFYLLKGIIMILLEYIIYPSNLFSFLFTIPTHQQNFLWGGRDGEFKFHLVNWSVVCSPIKTGGLGVRNLQSGFVVR